MSDKLKTVADKNLYQKKPYTEARFQKLIEDTSRELRKTYVGILRKHGLLGNVQVSTDQLLPFAYGASDFVCYTIASQMVDPDFEEAWRRTFDECLDIAKKGFMKKVQVTVLEEEEIGKNDKQPDTTTT